MKLWVFPFLVLACHDTTTSPASRGIVVFDGNSLTSPLHGHVPYPDFVMRSFPDLRMANVAVPGQTTVQMIASATEKVDALKTPGPVNIVVLWEGTNDLYFGSTPEQAYQHLVDYSLARRKAGWKVVILTLMPRTGVNTRADFESVRQSLNTMIRSRWRAFADQLDDIALDPRFGAPDAELNTTYFEDGTHLTQYGIEEIAKLAAPPIGQMMR